MQEDDSPIQYWKPRDEWSSEDTLLFKYWEEVGGRIYAEAPVGGDGRDQPWPAGAKMRWLDGLRIADPGPEYPDAILRYSSELREEIQDLVHGRTVEIIEIKRKLNRPVIGQAIVGADMLRMEHHIRTLTPVVLCRTKDPSLEIVCQKRGIRVWLPDDSPS